MGCLSSLKVFCSSLVHLHVSPFLVSCCSGLPPVEVDKPHEGLDLSHTPQGWPVCLCHSRALVHAVFPTLSIHSCIYLAMPHLHPKPSLMHPCAFIHGCPCPHHALCPRPHHMHPCTLPIPSSTPCVAHAIHPYLHTLIHSHTTPCALIHALCFLYCLSTAAHPHARPCHPVPSCLTSWPHLVHG